MMLCAAGRVGAILVCRTTGRCALSRHAGKAPAKRYSDSPHTVPKPQSFIAGQPVHVPPVPCTPPQSAAWSWAPSDDAAVAAGRRPGPGAAFPFQPAALALPATMELLGGQLANATARRAEGCPAFVLHRSVQLVNVWAGAGEQTGASRPSLARRRSSEGAMVRLRSSGLRGPHGAGAGFGALRSDCLSLASLRPYILPQSFRYSHPDSCRTASFGLTSAARAQRLIHRPSFSSNAADANGGTMFMSRPEGLVLDCGPGAPPAPGLVARSPNAEDSVFANHLQPLIAEGGPGGP